MTMPDLIIAQIFKEYEMNNKGYIELAEQLGVSKKTIYMRVYKAKNPIKYRQYRDKYDAKRRSEYQVKKANISE